MSRDDKRGHREFCRRQMETIAPEYGSDCTCGLEYLIDYVAERFDEGPKAVAEFLNWTVMWIDVEGDNEEAALRMQRAIEWEKLTHG